MAEVLALFARVFLVVAALFRLGYRGMPAGGGMSQTAVADGAGAKSPLTGIVGAVTVVVTVLFLAPVFSNLPEATLGALVFVAAVGLIDVGKVRVIFATNRRDGILTVLAALGVASMGALDGILIAVLISVLALLFENSRRRLEVVGQISTETPAMTPVPRAFSWCGRARRSTSRTSSTCAETSSPPLPTHQPRRRS
jgi:MFS superfamily sulfate permease-like transporter